jgi:hypothetical protein
MRSFRFQVSSCVKASSKPEAGQEWIWGNWGVRWPIRRVTFHLRQGFGGQVGIKRGDTSGGKPVAVFRFLSEDWSPWIALVRMRERWPELRFEMKAGYLQIGE